MSGDKIVTNFKIFLKVQGCSVEKLQAIRPGVYYVCSKVSTSLIEKKASEWTLKLYPNGQSADKQGFISVYLYLDKTDFKAFDISVKFGTKCKDKSYKIRSQVNRSSTWWKNNLGGGFGKWISHEELCDPEGNYLQDGELTIFCEIDIMRSNETLQPDLKKLKEDYHMTDTKDCEIHTSDGQVLKCHKLILTARSPIFREMLQLVMDQSSVKIHIDDFDAKTLKQLLRFAYEYEIEDLTGIAPKLIHAAEKFQMKELKNLCLDRLIKDLKQENVLQSLAIAEQITNAEELFEKCLDVAVRCYDTLNNAEEWNALRQPTLLKILRFVMPKLAQYELDSTAKI